MTQILTFLGRSFDVLQPDSDMIDPRDIAHALAHICRFGGHTARFYSVAQHSCIVADLVPAEHRLAALLHDATEAYVGDMVRPLKLAMPDYQDMEQRLWVSICARFWISPDLPSCVMEADMIALATERRDLMPPHPARWSCLEGVTPITATIRPWDAQEARDKYFKRLMDQLATEHRRKAGEVIVRKIRGDSPALLRTESSVAAQKTDSLCCAAAGITEAVSATAEDRIPYETLRQAATPEHTLNAGTCPPAQLAQGYKSIPNPDASLKACPFCGSPAAFGASDEGCWIECMFERCGASTNIRISMGEDCHPLLAEQWNSRAPHTDTQLIEWLDIRGDLWVEPETSTIRFPHAGDTEGYGHIREALIEAFTLDHGGEV